MADGIAPYLRYYSSHRPDDDHGSRPIVLVVFEDETTQTHFLRVARDEMARTGVDVPLRVSHRSLMERVGPLGRAWRTTDSTEPGYAFQERGEGLYNKRVSSSLFAYGCSVLCHVLSLLRQASCEERVTPRP